MTHYFRITAYHPEKDICAIFDSNGKFEKLWQFSSYLIHKGFQIIEVGNDETFDEGDFIKIEPCGKLILRACDKGKPKNQILTANGIQHKTISIKNHSYIPDTASIVYAEFFKADEIFVPNLTYIIVLSNPNSK